MGQFMDYRIYCIVGRIKLRQVDVDFLGIGAIQAGGSDPLAGWWNNSGINTSYRFPPHVL